MKNPKEINNLFSFPPNFTSYTQTVDSSVELEWKLGGTLSMNRPIFLLGATAGYEAGSPDFSKYIV